MAARMWMIMACALIKFTMINIIAAISRPPPLISQLFPLRLFEGRISTTDATEMI